jgi:hypothetical protein
MSTPSKFWKPSQAQCRIIKAAAAVESGVKADQIRLEPGMRLNRQNHEIDSCINIARVTRNTDGSWEDTDLDDRVGWRTFKSGVPLTEDGRAIVDFYIHRYGYANDELLGNIVVHFENGELSKIGGYGSNSEHRIS